MNRTTMLAICLSLSVVCTAAGAATYTIQDLGTLGGPYAVPYGINDAGQVAGISTTSDGYYRAFVWANGVMTDPGTLGGGYGQARNINRHGDVVGAADTEDWETHAFLLQNGQMQDLGVLGGWYSCAYSVNDAGKVVGSSYTDMLEVHAFKLENGVMVDLGTLGGIDSQANCINNLDQVAGHASTPEGNWHAVIWENGNTNNLGVIGTAYSINDAGQAVGISYQPDWSWRAFLYDNGAMTDLGTLGGPTSTAYDINMEGVIVGQNTLSTGRTVACLWKDGAVVDLNTLLPPDSVWQLVEATSVNDSGQVAGWGMNNGEMRSFLLSPKTSIPVQIDVSPGNPNNLIRLSENGHVDVAILACPVEGQSEWFDPAQVDPSTVTFAGAPFVQDARGGSLPVFQDVNADTRTDLILRFGTTSLQLSPTDTTAALQAKTLDGTEITGEDTIAVELPKEKNPRKPKN